MNRRSAVRMLATTSAGCFFPAWPAGAAPQNPKKNYTLRSDVVLVLLDVSVKDNQDRFVPGLVKDNFTIAENGKPQRVTVFDAEDRPVTVGILLDESLSMMPKRQDVLAAAEALIRESNREDEIFVLHFNDTVTPGLPRGVPFSGNIQQLRAALSSGIPGGKTALNDALVAGFLQLRLGKRDKKTVVLVSDGGDTASRHSRKATLEMVQRSPATIYTIGLYDPNDPDHDTGFLRRIAKMTGGEAYLPSNPKELVPLCRQIAKEIRTRYTIGYTPEWRPDANSLRRIEVHARAPGHGKLMVRARRSYRYE
ncbi:MAG: VWA domain-containing protein [Bryobacteraceae bacterium]